MSRHGFRALLGIVRFPFLILTPACVALGVASTAWTGAHVNYGYVLLILVGAVSAHASVNALNEYSDYRSGLDFKTTKTPFSGGSGTLPRFPERAGGALIAGWACFILTGLIGVYFVSVVGPGLIPIGVVGLITIATYTDYITRSPVLCLIAPGLGFGPCMVMGTDYVLSGSYSWTAFIVSLIPLFLVSNLLLLNQFPDVDADRSIGRNHFPIVKGRQGAAVLYGVFLAGAYGSILIGYAAGWIPAAGLVGLGTGILAIPTVRGVARYADEITKLVPHMGRNVLITLATPVLLATGMLWEAAK